MKKIRSLAKDAVPKILTEQGRADEWKEKNLSGVPAGDIPGPIAALLAQIDTFRDTPGMLLATLRECDAVTDDMLWGARADGRQDPYQYESMRGSLVSRLAKGESVAGTIRHLVKRLDEVTREIEQARAWHNQAEPSSTPLPMVRVPEPKPTGVKIDADFD